MQTNVREIQDRRAYAWSTIRRFMLFLSLFGSWPRLWALSCCLRRLAFLRDCQKAQTFFFLLWLLQGIDFPFSSVTSTRRRMFLLLLWLLQGAILSFFFSDGWSLPDTAGWGSGDGQHWSPSLFRSNWRENLIAACCAAADACSDDGKDKWQGWDLDWGCWASCWAVSWCQIHGQATGRAGWQIRAVRVVQIDLRPVGQAWSVFWCWVYPEPLTEPFDKLFESTHVYQKMRWLAGSQDLMKCLDHPTSSKRFNIVTVARPTVHTCVPAASGKQQILSHPVILY